MVGVAGYLLRGDNYANLIDTMLSECASPYVENDVVKTVFGGKAIGLILPRGRALYDFAYNKTEEKGAIVYGYAIVDRKRLSAKEVMEMNEDKLHETLKKADDSFLIVKLESDKVWIATDWLGTRPLYYATVSNGIVFSSCFWSVLRFLKETNHPIKLDDTAILSYLWIGRIGVIGNKTFVEGVSLAPPGTLLVYDLKRNKLDLYQYYRLKYETKIRDEKLAILVACYAILKSIKRVLNVVSQKAREDMCTFLSGGLDSRIVTYILSKYIKNLKVLTYGTKRCDEVVFTRHVARAMGIKHIVESYDLDELAKDAYEIVRLSDEFTTLSNFAYVGHALKMLLKNGCRVFTSGFALDLTLGGSFMGWNLKNVKNESEFNSYIYEKISIFNHKELLSIADSKLRYQMLDVIRELKNLVKLYLESNYLNSNDKMFLYTRVRRWTLCWSLILRHASEELLPTVSREFMELIAKIDPSLRRDHKIFRKVIFKLNKKLGLIPYNHTWVPPILPIILWKAGTVFRLVYDFIRKATKGHVRIVDTTYLDFDEALRYKGWKKLLRELLLERGSLIYKFGYLNYEAVKNMVVKHLSGRVHLGEKLGYIMTLELILREIAKYMSER